MRPGGAPARRAAGCLAFAVLLAAGCSGGGPVAEPRPVSAPLAAAPVPRVLAEATVEAPRVIVRVMTVERTGAEAVTVRFLLVNPDAARPVGVSTLFAGAGQGEPLSGICLADESLKKRFFVMRDAGGQPQCTTGLREIPPGGQVEAWIRLAAPPPEARQATLLLPGLSPVRSLPIADATAGTTPGRASY